MSKGYDLVYVGRCKDSEDVSLRKYGDQPHFRQVWKRGKEKMPDGTPFMKKSAESAERE